MAEKEILAILLSVILATSISNFLDTHNRRR